jgi:cytochrome P450
LTPQTGLPPGPPYPAWYQGMGFWNRPLPFLERCRARYGKRFTLRIPMAPPFVMLADPDDVKQVFMAPPEVLHPGEGAKVLEPVVGLNSVILLDEAAHMEQRKLILPAFHGEKMTALTGLMSEIAEEEIASWPRESATQLHPRLQRLTLEIILRAVFGLDVGERLDRLRERLGKMLEFGDKWISLVPPSPESRMRPILERWGPFVPFARAQQEADALIFELIEERRADGAERNDILSMLLEARHEDGSPMSPEEIRDELMTMLVAGHETTASTLAWAFEKLPRHPEVLAKLRDEIDSGGDDDTYLTATIQETLRRRPVLPNNAPRLVKQEIQVGDWTYPTGAALIPNAYLIHHDPEIYDDPYAFRPERFVGESPGTYTWIPFGGGRRRCIGASFAMVEMKIVMRAVIVRYQISPARDGAEVAKRRNITVRPAGGTRTVLRDRAATRDRVPAAA